MNHLAVAAALHRPECQGCRYGENADIFPDILYDYTLWKIRYHRIIGNRWDSNSLVRHGGYETVYSRLMQAAERLERIWPCPACIVAFNPTKRKRRLYSGRRNRSW